MSLSKIKLITLVSCCFFFSSYAQDNFSILNSSGDTLFTITGEGKALLKNIELAVPIGTIQAWAKNLSGVPTLQNGWVECNGQILSDPGSPMNGTQIPDLNSRNKFLRGSVSSGAEGDGIHNHQWGSGDLGFSHGRKLLVASGNHNNRHYTRTFDIDGNVIQFIEDSGLLTNSYYTDTVETIPRFYEVVWIIKVK